jgi:TRAP transporter 4TM/12TM fusion protein
LIPAILYYVSVYAQVHFSSLRNGFGRLDDDKIPSFVETMRDGWLFVIPLGVLTTALIMGFTPTMVGIFGTITVFAVSLLRAKSRIGPIALMKVLSETCYRMAPVAGACAAAGLIIGGLTMTGLVGKFAHVIYGITDAQTFSTLLLAAALTIILGLGMPTPAAYIIGAALMTPILTEIGVPTLSAHMFVLYYAVMSALTPPVAVAAYAASSIAEDNPLLIAILAVKFALAAFIVPFAFVYGPELLMVGPWHLILTSLATAIVGLILIGAAVEAYFMAPLAIWERALLAVTGFGLVVPNVLVSVAAFLVAAIYIAVRYNQRKAEGRAG